MRSTTDSTMPRSVPSRRTRWELTSTTRSPTAADRGVCTGVVATSSTRAVRPTSVTGVPMSAVTPNRVRALSLITRTTPDGSMATTPSPIECSTAPCSRTSSASWSGSRPRVRRRHRRASSAEPMTPVTSAASAMRTRAITSPRRSSLIFSVEIPTLTSPTTSVESGARTGTLARTDSPSVPRSVARSSRPPSARPGSVLRGRVSSVVSGCASLSPRLLAMTTKRAPVRSATATAWAWSGPSARAFWSSESPLPAATSART